MTPSGPLYSNKIVIKFFQLFVIRNLIKKCATFNVKIAKTNMWEKEPFAWEMLQEVN